MLATKAARTQTVRRLFRLEDRDIMAPLICFKYFRSSCEGTASEMERKATVLTLKLILQGLEEKPAKLLQ